MAIDVGYVLTSLNRFPVSIVLFAVAKCFWSIVYWFTFEVQGFGERRERKGSWGWRKISIGISCFFMLSIFLVVQGLETAGPTNLLALMHS